MKQKIFTICTLVVAAVLVALDQITKHIADATLMGIGTKSVISGVLSFTYVENAGAAFGIFQGGRWFFAVLTLAITVAAIIYYRNLPKGRIFSFMRGAIVLIVAGALGNCIDRVRQGYVVDFIHVVFVKFPVFNLADIYVVVGTLSFAALLAFFVKDDEGIR
ncbi:lipoprotein signal peptidase [Clostridia bacterium]|nr:lipoprotein signal peptidase [Clostridia bacterium]